MNLLDADGTELPSTLPESQPAARLTDPLTPLQAMILLEGVDGEDEAREILLWAHRTRAQQRVLDLALAGMALLAPQPDETGAVTMQFRLLTEAEVRDRWSLNQPEGIPHG